MVQSRQEFEKVVTQMQDEGVPLTMANLLVRTELPRATIETWLDAMQRDGSGSRVSTPPPATEGTERAHHDGSVRDRANALKEEIVSELVRARLGFTAGKKSDGPKRDLKVGAILGVVLPPAGLAYAAPWEVVVVAGLGYLVLAWLAFKLAILGGIFGLLVPAHLVGGLLSAGYVWRYNRRGRRTHLLPGSRKRD